MFAVVVSKESGSNETAANPVSSLSPESHQPSTDDLGLSVHSQLSSVIFCSRVNDCVAISASNNRLAPWFKDGGVGRARRLLTRQHGRGSCGLDGSLGNEGARLELEKTIQHSLRVLNRTPTD